MDVQLNRDIAVCTVRNEPKKHVKTQCCKLEEILIIRGTKMLLDPIVGEAIFTHFGSIILNMVTPF